MNATSPTMHEEWAHALAQASEDDTVKVVVVTGAGRAFCAGKNLRLVSPQDDSGRERRRAAGEHNVALMLHTLTKPYIGAINGPAVGGGLDMASQCDIRLASTGATFNTGYIRMGALPSQGGLWTLPRIIGISHALELLWTGRTFGAEEALRIGYVNAVLPQDGFLDHVYTWCKPLVEGPQVAIREDKRMVYGLEQTKSLSEAITLTEEAVNQVQGHPDATEGPRAWLERRHPQFDHNDSDKSRNRQ